MREAVEHYEKQKWAIVRDFMVEHDCKKYSMALLEREFKSMCNTVAENTAVEDENPRATRTGAGFDDGRSDGYDGFVQGTTNDKTTDVTEDIGANTSEEE